MARPSIALSCMWFTRPELLFDNGKYCKRHFRWYKILVFAEWIILICQWSNYWINFFLFDLHDKKFQTSATCTNLFPAVEEQGKSDRYSKKGAVWLNSLYNLDKNVPTVILSSRKFANILWQDRKWLECDFKSMIAHIPSVARQLLIAFTIRMGLFRVRMLLLSHTWGHCVFDSLWWYCLENNGRVNFKRHCSGIKSCFC